MVFLDYKKFFIEVNQNSSNYGVLIFDEHIGRGEGLLKYYNAGLEYTDADFEHQGTREWAEEIIKLAKAKCEELGGVLFKY